MAKYISNIIIGIIMVILELRMYILTNEIYVLILACVLLFLVGILSGIVLYECLKKYVYNKQR